MRQRKLDDETSRRMKETFPERFRKRAETMNLPRSATETTWV
jgi:hypothetical protein